MKDFLKGVAIGALTLLLAVCLIIPYDRGIKTLCPQEKAENRCKAIISLYNSNCLTYEQYKGNKAMSYWAEQAKIRANETASSYNIYILQNSHIWSGNIPDQLEYIEE